MADTVETAIYRLRVEGQAEIDRLTKSVDGLAVAEEKAASSTRTFSQSLQNQVARIDPVVKAQEQYRKALETQQRYRESGVGTEAQLNAQLSAATRLYQQQTGALQNHTNVVKLQRHELINLSRQFQDVGVSLFSGQSPLTVMMQQGTQIADVFANSQGTVRGFFGQVAAGARALITPMTAAIAGVAALTAAAAALALQWDKVQKSSDRALLGAGAKTGTTVGDLNRFVEQNAGIGGTSLSQKEARTLAEDFTKTGDVVISRLRGMSDAVVGFATLSGKSMSDAGKDMVKFATDPLKAMEELEKTYGKFGAATRKAVEALAMTGDKTGAFQVLVDSLAETNKEAANSMGVLEKASRSLVNVLAQETGKPTGLEQQLENVKAKLNTAIAAAPDMLVPAEASDNVAKLSREFETLYAAIEKINASRVAATNNISAATQEAVRAAQLELPVIQAITEAQKQAAQYAADYYNALAAAKSPADALALASINLEKSQAAATAAVYKQVESLKDSTEMIKAQKNGTEATTAAAIAYRNAIASGADETSAAALKAATLANYMAQAGSSAVSMVDALNNFNTGKWQSLASAMAQAGSSISWSQGQSMAEAENAQFGGSAFAPTVMPAGPLTFAGSLDAGVNTLVSRLQSQATAESAGIAGLTGTAYQSGGIAGALAAIRAAPDTFGASDDLTALGRIYGKVDFGSLLGPERSNISEKISTYDQLTQLMNQQTTDKGAQAANLQSELEWLQTLPVSIERDQKIVDLTNSIADLKSSTDDLNSTNKELLSPYYTQDPRTSKIGFRSQGMADGGYVDVPGGYSANDNMMAMVPVASGERIYVDPMTSRRGGAGGTTINISAPMTFAGNVNRDEVGRTVYQTMQNTARSIQAASQ